MREEDIRKEARKLFNELDKEEQVIGTSSEYVKDKNSSYLECTTLLAKKTKNPQRIANIIKSESGRDPLKVVKKEFTMFTWQYFPSET